MRGLPPPRSSSTIGSSNTSIGSKILFRRRQSRGNENVLLVLDLESTYGVYVALTVLGIYRRGYDSHVKIDRQCTRTHIPTYKFVSIIPATDFIYSSSPSPAILSVARVIVGVIVPSLFTRMPKRHSQFFPPVQKTVKLLRDGFVTIRKTYFHFAQTFFPADNRNAATCRLQ